MRRPEPQRVREGSAGLEKIQRAETGLRPQTLGTCESGLFTHVKLLLVSVLSQQRLNSALGSDGVNHHPEQLIKTFPRGSVLSSATAVSSSAWLMGPPETTRPRAARPGG